MIVLALALAAQSAPLERRCGWLINPTPANWWLRDRTGEWTLSMQGGYQAPGWEELPPMGKREWVATNGSYGHGCACAAMRVDRRSGEVTEIRSLTPRPIAACRRDRRLPKP